MSDVMTIVSLPPLIKQNFSKDLLSTACKLQDTLDKYDQELIWLKEYAKKKIRPQDTRKRKKFDRLIERWEFIYGWAKAKEEELKAKGKNADERLLYYAWGLSELDRRLLHRLRIRKRIP